MNKLPIKFIVAVTLLSMAVSSMASERITVSPSLQPSASAAPLTAPTVLSQKVALNPAELARYQLYADQSKNLAARELAGASNTAKIIVITVGVVVVIVTVAAMTTFRGMEFHHGCNY